MEKIASQSILLVDDRPENLLVLESILESPDINFIKATSGEEALRLLLKEDVSLILLDVQMPGIDGFETAALIRGAQKTKHIPIIFVTAISKEQKHIFKGYEAGAVDYMFKPVVPEIVRSKVNIFLELDRQRRILKYQNEELTAAKKNTDNIFANVEEGLLLLNQKYEIKPQYSSALNKILSQKKLADKNLMSILKEKISKDVFDNTNIYFELLFQDDINEKACPELNPLINVEYQADEFENMPKSTRYLSFNFKRIYKYEKIDELIVTVTDNTEQVLLERKLKKTELESKRQMELLGILHIEPLLVKEFLKQTWKELDLIQSQIAKISNSGKLSDNIELIYHSIHSIKGNASLLNLKFIAEKAHQFEDNIIILKDNSSDLKTELIVLKNIADEIVTAMTDIGNLIKTMKNFYEHFNSKTGHEGELLIKAIQDIIGRLKKEYNKNINFIHKSFDVESIPPEHLLLVKDVLIQLTRNSIVHSIESEEERKKNKKSPAASISLSSKLKDKYLTLIFKDDGRGLQIDKIREKAIALKKWSKAEIMKWDKKRIAELIFVSGISTSLKTSLISGRGVGMGVIKQKLEEMNGKIELDYEAGQFCEFRIIIPV